MTNDHPLADLPNKPRKLSDSYPQSKEISLLSQHRKHNPLIQGCDSIQNYLHLNKIHEGVYGVVFRAKDIITNQIYAIKKVKLINDQERGFPVTSIREIQLLMGCDCDFIVKLKEIVTGDALDKIYLVMEYCEHELKDLMDQKHEEFGEPEIKQIMLQLLKGMEYLHSKSIMHRDLKPSNLLYNNEGKVKICDLGLARKYTGQKNYTAVVVTLWYRAIEVLLGNEQYGMGIDIWSLGCIFAELVNKEPLFRGKQEGEQIDLIFKMFGTPTEQTWPGWSQQKYAKTLSFNKYAPSKFSDKIKKGVISDNGIKLMREMLQMDPSKRITASKALKHDWFKESPPCDLANMPKFAATNEISRENRKQVKLE